MSQQAAIILAAGDGKRMMSKEPKVMAEVLFKPMLSWVLDSVVGAGIANERTCVVISPAPGKILEILPAGVKTAVQTERRGTGHAVMAAEAFIRLVAEDDVLVLYGDAPFVDRETIAHSYAVHKAGGYAATMVTVLMNDPAGYGRILRKEGVFDRIVEAADASPEEYLIHEINPGVYWFKAEALLEALPRLGCDNTQHEYYLTDVMGILKKSVGIYTAKDSRIFMGANDRRQLAALNAVARDSVLDRLYDLGVDILITDGVIISPDVQIGAGSRILPGTIITGTSVIGEDCVIGPNSRIMQSEIGSGSVINQSQIDCSVVGSGVRIGPFAQLRPNCKIADGVKIGNFVEIKNTAIGKGSSTAHLTYLGDSDIGAGVNIGCGVVTVNYDGQNKYRTTVEDGAFVGCNSNLIAPVTVGSGGYVAAGTTVTEDVPPQALTIGRARQTTKPGWRLGRQKDDKNKNAEN